MFPPGSATIRFGNFLTFFFSKGLLCTIFVILYISQISLSFPGNRLQCITILRNYLIISLHLDLPDSFPESITILSFCQTHNGVFQKALL